MEPSLALTVASLALAAVMSAVAWRLAREDRRRSAARVATLAAAIHDELEPGHAVGADLFAATPPAAARGRLAAAIGLGVLVVGSAVALALVLGSTPRSAGPGGAAVSSADLPLEL